MTTRRKKRSPEEKLSILREGETYGVAATCRKHGIADSMFYKWRDKYDVHGLEGLRAYGKRENTEVRMLEDENRRLKQILADKELELQIKNDLLKKKGYPTGRNGR